MRHGAPAFRIGRAAGLLTLGALAVHQLRYLVAYGAGGGEALHREGHGYLLAAIPVIVALAAAAVMAGLLVAALRGDRGHAHLRSASGLLYAGALFAVFAAQELAEGALAPGHPAGLDGLVENGAWVAVPLAVVLGYAAALAERLLGRADAALAAALGDAPRPALAAEPLPLPPSSERTPLAALPLAFGLARRPPPVSSLA